MAIFDYDPFPENTSAGKAFKAGYDRFVQTDRQPDVFWDPVDHRWETYRRARFVFGRTGIARVTPGTDYWSERSMLHDVINLGKPLAGLGAHVVWDPRDGWWYTYADSAQQPPPSQTPDWLARLNADLAALDRNTNLTPQERMEARSALIQRAYGQPH